MGPRLSETSSAILKMVVAFVLTTVMGTFLSYKIEQYRANEHDRKVAIGLYYDVLDTLSRRSYYGFKAYQNPQSDWFERYEGMVTYHNEKLFRNSGLIRHHFGEEAYEKYVGEVVPILGQLHNSLLIARRGDGTPVTPARVHLDELHSKVEELNTLIFAE